MAAGAGRCPVERLQYFSEHVTAQLAGLEQIILVGAPAPVSFFAYPGKESWLVPEGCEVIELFCEVDGNFPNHHPDPSKEENLQDLIAVYQAAVHLRGVHDFS